MEQLFFSYSRADNDFALKLARDLRSEGVNLWVDQLDIAAGDRWDQAVEEALGAAPRLLVILSPDSVASQNVMDEVSLAFDEQKKIVPVLSRRCNIPFRLRRLQHIDLTVSYDSGLAELLKALKVEPQAQRQKGLARQSIGPAVSLAGVQGDTAAAKPQVRWLASAAARKYLLLCSILALAGAGYIFRGYLEGAGDRNASAPGAETQTKRQMTNRSKYTIADFTGEWVNENPEGGITRAVIQQRLNKLAVHMWGKCHPADCDWGTVDTATASAKDGSIQIVWNSSFSARRQELRIRDDRSLGVFTKTEFTDKSGRPSYESVDYLKRK